jgi:hypothetical protein
MYKISIITISIMCLFFTGCFQNHPKTWSELLKTTPKELQIKQNNLKESMNKLQK